ncbi:hypothetical protein FB451DRAFT_1217952 [Mycena latifolia]|nr:hypothetical protein FB451DRAFT_1217952 [Mycena latifolia]
MSSPKVSDAPGPYDGRCEYNVSWMDRTFRSRKYSESLLAPELENGNLSRQDYEALMRSLPGIQYSDLTGFAMSGTGVILYSRFKPPKISVGLLGYLCGLTVGKGLRMYTHLSFFRSIENINGFERAMANVKRKVPYDRGLVSFTAPLSSDWEQPPFEQEADTFYGQSPEPSAAVATTVPAAPTPKAPLAKSRWEEIRATRRVDAPSKAWENIRQGRKPDGTLLPKQTGPESESGQPWTPSTFRDSDRAAEQASFDAMLERERSRSSS